MLFAFWLLSLFAPQEAATPDSKGEAAPRPEARAIDPGEGRHWAYRPLRRAPPPAVEHGAWCRNPIDRFVLRRLERAGIEPAPEADRRTLIRRLSLDLTGLPVAVEDLRRLAADARPGTLDRLVDRLLGSPRYGERMARPWLDLARYADTKGYEKDARRSIWLYRDWVVRAFNDDMPFDRFTKLQLAGDLLPAAADPRAREEQLVATAFHRNTMTNDEGGTDDEEFRCAAVVDRVNTTMQVWLGTTFGCAQCHDHKYDPFSQKEYYRLFAFFNQTADADRPDDRPVLRVPTEAQRARLESWQQELRRLERAWSAAVQSARPQRARWEARMRRAIRRHADDPPRLSAWRAAGPFPARDARAAFDAVFAPERGVAAGKHVWKPRPDYVDGKAHPLSGQNAATYLERTIQVAADRSAGLSLGSDDALKVWLNGELVLQRFVTRGVAPDQERTTVRLRKGSNRLLLKVVNGGGPSGFYFALRGVDLTEQEQAILQLPPVKRSAAERKTLLDARSRQVPPLAALRREIAATRTRIAGAKGATVPILRELRGDERRKTYVHVKGFFLSKGDSVEPDVPRALHSWPVGAPRNRLGLAEWLVAGNNPLTPRIVANRLWEMIFGRGLVEPSEDWGTRGEPPSHPELLDWLAAELVRGGWSIKKLLRTIVTSRTYRQSSRIREDLAEVDPANRLLARGPRGRLPAEMVRDQALAVSGLLSNKMFGPSVMPPQPPGIWRMVYSSDRWITSKGEDRHRRAIYTFWRRTAPYPSMVAFDAPSREYCVLRRSATNTPLQALVLLNDPVFVEAARALARRAANRAEPRAVDRIARLYERTLARRPSREEIACLARLYQDERTRFLADEPLARKVAAPVSPADDPHDPAELSAWTVVANVLLNLDEFLTKR